MEQTISRTDAAKKILGSNGKIFGVQFVKRSANKIRNMTARLHVTKHLRGGELNYDPKAHNLISVFSMDAQGYRMIGIEGLLTLKIGGIKYRIAN